MIKIYYYGKSVFTLESLQKHPKLYPHIYHVFKSIKKYMVSNSIDWLELKIHISTGHKCIIKDKHDTILYNKYFRAVSDYLTNKSPPYSYGLNYAKFWKDTEDHKQMREIVEIVRCDVCKDRCNRIGLARHKCSVCDADCCDKHYIGCGDPFKDIYHINMCEDCLINARSNMKDINIALIKMIKSYSK